MFDDAKYLTFLSVFSLALIITVIGFVIFVGHIPDMIDDAAAKISAKIEKTENQFKKKTTAVSEAALNAPLTFKLQAVDDRLVFQKRDQSYIAVTLDNAQTKVIKSEALSPKEYGDLKIQLANYNNKIYSQDYPSMTPVSTPIMIPIIR